MTPGPLVRFLVRLYPPAWRKEFGDEFADLLGRSRMSAPMVANVVTGAAGEWAVSLLRRISGGLGMEDHVFEARYDRMARILSGVLVVVLLVIPLLVIESGWVAVFAAFCSLTVVGLSYAYSPRGYLITGGTLRIQRLVGDVVFQLDRLRFVRDATPADYWGCVRLWGSSGMFGYYGRYWSSGLGTARWYVTDRSRALIVTDGNGMILVSPADREAFVAALAASGAPDGLPSTEQPEDWRRFLTVGGLLGAGVGIVAIGFTVAAFRYDPGRPPVDLRQNELEIHSRFYGMRVAAADVDASKVRVVDLSAEKDWRPTLRVGGFSNSHYRAGNFRVANGKTVKLFTTGARRLVLIPPAGEGGTPVLLDVSDPDAFVNRVRTLWARP